MVRGIRLTRRRFLRQAGSLMAMPALAPRAAGAQPAAFRELRRGVGLFAGPGGTIGWLATRGGALVVDSQFPATAAACLDALRRRTPAAVQALVNTHHHADHTAGNVTLRPATARIVQHERCAAAHKALVATQGAEALRGLADVTFTDVWSATIGDERVSAVHLGAAHTGGDALVFFERANVVHAGDLVFNRIPPFIDRASGGSIVNWVTVLDALAKRHPDAQFIFGHGRQDMLTGTVKDVIHFRDYLTAALEHVRQGLAAGRTQEAIVSLPALPGFADHADLVKNYASPIPLFTLNHVLTVAYQELTGR
jgi:glyoxylase-like metal-dependent hydrolase (beta-lactamase superfamily II)